MKRATLGSYINWSNLAGIQNNQYLHISLYNCLVNSRIDISRTDTTTSVFETRGYPSSGRYLCNPGCQIRGWMQRHVHSECPRLWRIQLQTRYSHHLWTQPCASWCTKSRRGGRLWLGPLCHSTIITIIGRENGYYVHICFLPLFYGIVPVQTMNFLVFRL